METDLANIVRAAAPGTGVQLRRAPYGKNGIRQFLRDVVAMANASVDGARYIIVGVEIDKKGDKRLYLISFKALVVQQRYFDGSLAFELGSYHPILAVPALLCLRPQHQI